MGFLTRNLKQKVTYWATSGRDITGAPAWTTPIALKARWEDLNELFINDQGEEVRSRAVIYLNSDVETSGYLFLGTSVVADPTTLSDAFPIKAFRKVPEQRGVRFERRAML